MDIITNITRVNVALGIFLTRYGCFPSGSQGLNLNVLLRTSDTIITAITGDLKLRKVSASDCSESGCGRAVHGSGASARCVLRSGPDT